DLTPVKSQTGRSRTVRRAQSSSSPPVSASRAAAAPSACRSARRPPPYLSLPAAFPAPPFSTDLSDPDFFHNNSPAVLSHGLCLHPAQARSVAWWWWRRPTSSCRQQPHPYGPSPCPDPLSCGTCRTRFMEAAASFNIYPGYLDARTMGATQNLASSATSPSASSPRDSGEGRIPEPWRQREGSPIASRLRSLRRL
ncbi:unnamed protein product, partial [Urochloa humidicola]